MYTFPAASQGVSKMESLAVRRGSWGDCCNQPLSWLQPSTLDFLCYFHGGDSCIWLWRHMLIWENKTEIFQSISQKFNTFNLSKKDASSFCKLLANKDWGTSQWICLVEEIKATSVNWSNLRWLNHAHDYILTTKVCMQHLMKLSIEASNI